MSDLFRRRKTVPCDRELLGILQQSLQLAQQEISLVKGTDAASIQALFRASHHLYVAQGYVMGVTGAAPGNIKQVMPEFELAIEHVQNLVRQLKHTP